MPKEYDASTQKFIDDVSGNPNTPVEPASPTFDIHSAKQAVKLTKALLTENPVGSVSKIIAKKGISALAHQLFEKNATEEKAPLHILTIYKQLNDKYDKSWFDWEPETIVQTLYHDYGIDLSYDGIDIIGALQLLLNTNQAHENWSVFEKVGHAFNSNIVDFSIIQPLRPDEVALTLSIINSIRPKEVYEPEIHAYIAASAKENGLVYLPTEYFSTESQDFLDKLGNDPELKNKVADKWNAKKYSSDNLVIDIQLKSLQEIKNYLEANK